MARKMNDSGVLPQEKMELDLEIPSSLVQTDGHLRRSNSAPMINGLRCSNVLMMFVSNALFSCAEDADMRSCGLSLQ